MPGVEAHIVLLCNNHQLMILRFNHVFACINIHSFYWWEYFHCVDATLFIRSPVDEHLGCFQFGATMNKASMDISVDFFGWMSFSFSIILGKYTGVKCLGCMPSVCWILSHFIREKGRVLTTSFKHLYLAGFLEFLLYDPKHTINCLSKFDMGFYCYL